MVITFTNCNSFFAKNFNKISTLDPSLVINKQRLTEILGLRVYARSSVHASYKVMAGVSFIWVLVIASL